MSDGEFRVVWQFLDGRDGLGVRRRLFQTFAGAQRHYDRLTSNGGRYDKTEDGTGIQTGELVVTHLRLDFARIEAREVGPFLPVSGFAIPAADPESPASGGEAE